MGEWLERYRQGDCVQVWEELYAFGPAVRQGDVYPDAEAVALETMRRVCHNIEVVIPRLEELGYEFGYAWMKQERFRVEVYPSPICYQRTAPAV